MFAFLAASRSKRSPSKPASTSTSPSSASPNHNIFFPSHRHEVRQVILLPPGHLSGSQANIRRKRARSDSSTSQPRAAPVVNSHLALPYRPAVANSSQRRAPLPKILSIPGVVQFKANDALRILCEIPIHCDMSHVDIEPSVDTLANGNPNFDDRRFALMPWRRLHDRTQQQQFVDTLRRLPGFGPTPGGFRTLENETDAKEAFVVNVIAPILPILNAFLSEDYREKLQVQLFSEVQKSETGRRRTDHALMLVDTTENADGLRILKIKQALVIIEAKTTGKRFRKLKGLTIKQKNMKVILPQILMYCSSWSCSRVILTDYSDTIAVDVNHMDIVEKKEDVRLSYIDVSTLTGHEDVFSYGPRATIAFQVFQALRELGLLDDELFPHAQGKLEGLLHRYLYRNQHSSPTPPPPPPPARKDKVQQPLTQPTKFQPRETHNSKNAGYAEAVRGGH